MHTAKISKKNENASSSRRRARDFDTLIREVLKVATAEYRCCIATLCAFPEAKQADHMAVQAWLLVRSLSMFLAP